MSQEPEDMFLHIQDASLVGADVNAGDIPYPPPTQTCPPCQPIATEIDDLNGELYDLEVKLYNSQGDKGEILKQIKEVKQQIMIKARALHQCEEQNGCTTNVQVIQGILNVGQVEIWSDNPQLPFVDTGGPNITLTFEGIPGAVWTLTRLDFTPISINGGKIMLENFISGHFDPASGSMVLNMELRAHIDDPIGGKDSYITLVFTTGTVQTVFTLPFGGNILTGFPFDKQIQQIALVAAGQFSGGYLDQINIGISLGDATANNWPQN